MNTMVTSIIDNLPSSKTMVTMSNLKCKVCKTNTSINIEKNLEKLLSLITIKTNDGYSIFCENCGPAYNEIWFESMSDIVSMFMMLEHDRSNNVKIIGSEPNSTIFPHTIPQSIDMGSIVASLRTIELLAYKIKNKNDLGIVAKDLNLHLL